MTRWILLLGLVAAAAFGAVALLGREDALEVEVVRVARGRVDETVSATRSGTLKPRVEVVLGAQAAGRVRELLHREPDRVAKGEPICILDDAEAQAQLLKAEQSLAASEADRKGAEVTLRDAERQARRQRRLLAQQAVSEEEVDRLEAKADLERAHVEYVRSREDEARAAVALARAQLDKTRVSAPFDGQVTDTAVESGQWVVPGTPVAEFVDDAELHVEAEFDEVDSALLAVGQETRMGADALPGERFAGRVISISPTVSIEQEKNRTVEVHAAWTSDRAKVRPGMSIEVEVVVATREDVLYVPSPAVLDRGGRRVVFVVEGGRARLRPVKAGFGNWEFTEVTEGLSEGDEVILSLGIPGLKDGVKVRGRSP